MDGNDLAEAQNFWGRRWEGCISLSTNTIMTPADSCKSWTISGLNGGLHSPEVIAHGVLLPIVALNQLAGWLCESNMH